MKVWFHLLHFSERHRKVFRSSLQLLEENLAAEWEEVPLEQAKVVLVEMDHPDARASWDTLDKPICVWCHAKPPAEVAFTMALPVRTSLLRPVLESIEETLSQQTDDDSGTDPDDDPFDRAVRGL